MSDAVSIQSFINDTPKQAEAGATLYDVASLLQDRKRMRVAVDQLTQHFSGANIDKVVGIDARGFILGSAIAEKLGVSFALARKKNPLPGNLAAKQFANLGETQLDIHTHAITPNERVLIVDDLIASGGSMLAAVHLIQRLQGNVAGCGVVINLPSKGGMQKLKALGLNTHALCTFDDA